MRTLGAILCTLLLSGFSASRCGATVYHSNGSEASVQALHNAALNGDTITLPAGTFSWTACLDITKSITLQGQTTITNAGTNNPTINDSTIIKDDTSRTDMQHGIMQVTLNPSQSFRLTGITFAAGGSTQLPDNNGAFRFISHGSSPSSLRIDNCHFSSLYQVKIIWINGWIYGVADHNVMHVILHSCPFSLWHNSWGGSARTQGHGSWADYPWYGTDKAWFIETNTVIRSNSPLAASLVDTENGGRVVVRHNYLENTIPAGHGTELRYRGQRTGEYYDNAFNFTVEWNGGAAQRTGTALCHDNTYTGRPSDDGTCLHLANEHVLPHYIGSPYGFSDGTSPWDQNDTDGAGHYVEGQPPHLFASGSATTGTTTSSYHATFTDSTKNWTTNQWLGYSITNTNPASPAYLLGSYIISNTSNTITYYYYPQTTPHMLFNSGDTYQIHRVLVSLDQAGRGKGDLVTGDATPLNTVTRTPSWTHEAAEPCYSWNNVYTPTNQVLNIGVGFRGAPPPVPKEGIDYFNLGGGFPADTTPSEVSSTYTAALNGVDYTGTFIYPHPLTLLPGGTARAAVADFNGDGKPDFVLRNPGGRQTAIWYLNNNVYIGSDSGPALPASWDLRCVADFNRDSHPDYGLFAPNTFQTANWYLSGSTFIGSAYGPTLPSGWELAAAADFNSDGSPDYVLYKPDTRQTAIWYLNNNVFVSGAYGPTLPAGWSLVGVADFNRDGHPDYALFNSITGQTAIWYLSGPTLIGTANGPTVPSGWALVATADFNGDGKPDYLLYNVNTQQTGIYYLNNNILIRAAWGPTLPPGWSFFGP